MFKQGISESALSAVGELSKTDLLKKFYLAGGTALAIHFGHRLSIDLDFFSGEPFSAEELVSGLERGGVKLTEIELAPETLHALIRQTKVSFLHYPYPLLEDLVSFEGIALASPLDIALMEIVAIASRGSRKDFIDLYFLLKKHGLSQIFQKFPLKFPVPKLDPYHYMKSITFFDDAETEPMPRMLVTCNWSNVKRELLRAVEKLVL